MNYWKLITKKNNKSFVIHLSMLLVTGYCY